nr:immunoglobulin light chain junction region [Macaca mulatta]MOW17924.1 immunoglobulin light chain junction region [Macaca mulatta]
DYYCSLYIGSGILVF